MLSGPPTITVDCLEELPEVRQAEPAKGIITEI
jgi:hypothetical protein